MSKINFAMFIAGASIGAAAAWLFTKRRYEQIAQEEIDSVKTVYAKRNSEVTPKPDDKGLENDKHKANMAKLKPDLVNYITKLQEEGYVNYTEHSQKNIEEKEGDNMADIPYVISPDEYGEEDDYDQISLTYYTGDGVLADDEDDVIDDTAKIVGVDFANHFGEYEDDSVFIRNDRMKCDYEILRDRRSYEDVVRDMN